jgi:dTDP-4-dehydrorhamnose 3,5-epimerase
VPRPEPILDPIGPILFHRQVHRDHRGAFVESYHERRYEELGFRVRFVQTNCSTTVKGVLRGLHFQHPAAQGKLVSVTRGAVYDVAVDIRAGSPTFGRWYGVELSADNGRQLWMPPDFAHGFVALSDEADLLYHCTAHYDPVSERTLRWDDPTVAVEWPMEDPVLSPKDEAGLSLRRLAEKDLLPIYRAPSARERPEGREPVTGAAAPVVL